jgi:hypothetical protein
MRKMIALACFGFVFTVSAPAFAAGEKMKGCNNEATGMKGEERNAFMQKCLSKDYELKRGAAMKAPAKPATPAMPAAASTQQDKMRMCNADAKAKALMGAERKAFMGECLKK